MKRWNDYDALIFTKHVDGHVTVDGWPNEILISDAFLEEVSPEFAVVGDGIINFHGVEPPACYGLSHADWLRNAVIGVKSPDAG